MERPNNLYEEASYDLNQFRERRMADRRFKQRDTPDRRMSHQNNQRLQQAAQVEKAEEGQKEKVA